MNKINKHLLAIGIFGAFASISSQSHATTVFNTTSLTDNAGGLSGDNDGDTATLALSGGGTIELTTVFVDRTGNAGDETLFIDNGTLGVGNELWGQAQSWEFSFDQAVDFDGFTFVAANTTFSFSSTAWGSDAAQAGANWSFSSDGTIGTFEFTATDNGGVTDFTTIAGGGNSNFSTVLADTSLTLAYFPGSDTGAGLTSFTISTIPEPSSFALLAGVFGLTGVMLRRRR